MKAVIMAGGEGTRLRPLTSQRPKPLVPALNVPIMEHIVLLLKQHGILDIVVTLHYLADEIEGYFGDGSEWGVNIFLLGGRYAARHGGKREAGRRPAQRRRFSDYQRATP